MPDQVEKGKHQDDRLSEWIKHWDDGHMSEFHVKTPHPKVLEHFDKIVQGKANARVFFPLCGDVVDMITFVERGHNIVGVECSELGVKTFFTDNKIEYTTEHCDKVKGILYKSTDDRYRIYCCDLFHFNASVEGQFDAIVDFGSMGAVRKQDLQAYADVMKTLMAPHCVHFLECFLYDLEKYPDSMPHCFSLEKLQQFYGDSCDVVQFDLGPNPYEEEMKEISENDKKKTSTSAQADDTTSSSTHSSGGDDPQQKQEEEKPQAEEEEFPEFTGAAYFMIRPKGHGQL